MATSFPVVKKNEEKGLKTRDWQLGLIIAGVVILFVVLLVPLGQTLKYMLDYHGFIKDASTSATIGRERGSITATVDGETYPIGANEVGDILGLLTDAGAGRRSTDEPEGGIFIDFGNGASLELSPVPITTESRLSDTGVLVRYTREDGNVFSYDSDRLSYDALLAELHLPS